MSRSISLWLQGIRINDWFVAKASDPQTVVNHYLRIPLCIPYRVLTSKRIYFGYLESDLQEWPWVETMRSKVQIVLGILNYLSTGLVAYRSRLISPELSGPWKALELCGSRNLATIYFNAFRLKSYPYRLITWHFFYLHRISSSE